MALKWETKDEIVEAQILWEEPHMGLRTCLIWIQKRPGWCDRGRYMAMTNAPIDQQDGWPRYYFDLDRAKVEIECWVAGRKEIK